MPVELSPLRVHSTPSRVRLCATNVVEVLCLDNVRVLTEELIF